MHISKTKDLLGQLSKLERTVSEFSFEELSADEAKALKNSFSNFKSSLEDHIYSPNNTEKVDELVVHKPEVEKKIGAQNQYIAHVSHEIRTPLNSIIGFANLLKEEKLTTSQQKKVQAIQFASNSLLKIINEVLEYSKISSGSNNFETIDFKIHNLLNDIMFLSETLMMDHQVELLIEIDKAVPQIIKGDPSKLSQVLLNLLGNAIKFVHQGHIKLKVSVREKMKDQYVLEFTVSDTGIGISEEKLKTIFESYTQSEDYTKYSGTGLGLSITKEIIEKQNGEIEISSKPGTGTTVTFGIPYALGNSKNIPIKRVDSVNIQKGKELLAGTKILVFEDNLMDPPLIMEQLTKWGCKVHSAVNLKKGLAILASKKIELILMDFKIPYLKDFEVSRAIRTHQDTRINAVPIVAFSADFAEHDSKVSDSLGINDSLLNPYTLDELMTIILDNKRKVDNPKEFSELLHKKMIQSKETIEFDLNHLLKDCFGELEMLNELVKLFKLNVLEFMGNVKIHLKSNDLKEVAFSAHKLKAGFAMLKATGMLELIVELETHSKANRPIEVKELNNIFLKDYPLFEKNLDDEMTSLNR